MCVISKAFIILVFYVVLYNATVYKLSYTEKPTSLKWNFLNYVCAFYFSDGFTSFRDAFPEWCEDDSTNTDTTHRGTAPTEQLMGLR